jgi:hypothetical protein
VFILDYKYKKVIINMENGLEETGVIVEFKEKVAFVRMDKDRVVLPFDIKDLSIVSD